MRTYEPRQGRKAATAVCTASAVVTLAFLNAEWGMQSAEWQSAGLFIPQSATRTLNFSYVFKCRMRNAEYGMAMPGLFIPQSAIRTLNLTYVLSSNSPKIPAAALQRRGGAGARHSNAQQCHRAKPHRARVSVLRSAR